MKLLLVDKDNDYEIDCPYSVASQWEYVSNYFDETSMDITEAEMKLELPMMIQDKKVVEWMIEFSEKNKNLAPVPKLLSEKAKDVMTIVPLENIGANFELSFIFKKLDIPDWCLEFFEEKKESKAENDKRIENVFTLTRYADLVGFKDLVNICVIIIASLYMTKVMNHFTADSTTLFSVKETNRLRKEILS